MILILSYKDYEQGTDPISEWLLYYKYPFRKITIEDLLTSSLTLNSQTGEVIINNLNLTQEINVILYRRFIKEVEFYKGVDLGKISKKINKESNLALKSIIDYMFFLLKDKYWVPNISSFSVNKEQILLEAKNQKLNTPRSIVTTSRKELIEFKKHVGEIIYKPIESFGYYQIGYYTYSSYVTNITSGIIKEFSDIFFPSLFQELIEAEYEIRTFYIDGEFYSSAILRSQKKKDYNVDVKLDFDKIDTDWVTYDLPNPIKRKIIKLMKRIDLITGSIDIIKSTNGKYYFLEVNPVGQYLAPSFLCNYNLPKIIAEWLIKKDRSLSI